MKGEILLLAMQFGVGNQKALSEQDFKFVRRYVGFYKGVQSAGAAVAWQVDTHKTSLLSQLIVNWGLTTISYPLLAVLVFLAVKDDNYSVSSIEDGKEKDTKMAAPSSLHRGEDLCRKSVFIGCNISQVVLAVV